MKKLRQIIFCLLLLSTMFVIGIWADVLHGLLSGYKIGYLSNVPVSTGGLLALTWLMILGIYGSAVHAYLEITND